MGAKTGIQRAHSPYVARGRAYAWITETEPMDRLLAAIDALLREEGKDGNQE